MSGSGRFNKKDQSIFLPLRKGHFCVASNHSPYAFEKQKMSHILLLKLQIMPFDLFHRNGIEFLCFFFFHTNWSKKQYRKFIRKWIYSGDSSALMRPSHSQTHFGIVFISIIFSLIKCETTSATEQWKTKILTSLRYASCVLSYMYRQKHYLMFENHPSFGCSKCYIIQSIYWKSETIR